MFTLTTDLIVGAAPPERAGAASAISETGVEFGGALGIALLGSIGTAVYREPDGRRRPGRCPAPRRRRPPGTPSAEPSRAPSTSPTGSPPRCSVAAREAFAQSVSVTATISVVIVLATAAVNVVLHRRSVAAARDGPGRSDQGMGR